MLPATSVLADDDRFRVSGQSLGSAEFRRDYGVRYAYVAGAMYKGIASVDMVVAMGKADLLSFLGTGGMRMPEIESSIQQIQRRLVSAKPYGMNLLCHFENSDVEERTVELFFKYGIRNVEAAAFMRITRALVRYRLNGIRLDGSGRVVAPNRVLAKVSRREVASLFMQPAPANVVDDLVAAGRLSAREAELSRSIPMADDVCVEADSGGHTDGGVAFALLPSIFALRDQMMRKHRYSKRIRVGAAGGIGTPHAAAAAFIMGADFVLTGSINQCTVEAGTSDAVKDILEELTIHDTAYAPAGDLFEIGAKVQVVGRGLFFAARANRLYELYQRHESIEEIDAKTRRTIEEKYLGRTFAEVWSETEAHYRATQPEKLHEIEHRPKQKMALIFRWYFVHSTRLALKGDAQHKVDYQIHCGPALGAFNEWVKGSQLSRWRARHVAAIGERIVSGTAALLEQHFRSFHEGARDMALSHRAEWSAELQEKR